MCVAPLCPHCHQPVYKPTFASHVRICLRNPAAAWRFCAALRELSSDGAMPTLRDYRARYREFEGLPSLDTLARVLGNWAAVAEFAGLSMEVEHAVTENAVPLTTEAELEAERIASLPGGMAVCRTRIVGNLVYSLLR